PRFPTLLPAAPSPTCLPPLTLHDALPISASPAAGSVAGVSVPDAFTALTMIPIGNPPLPFKGTDGKYHVAYDLQLTNATKVPASVDKIDVVDGTDPTKVIASFSAA